MKLNRIYIKNFRSIKDVRINFDPACRVLVGINEAGKSNILKALSLLNETAKTVRKNDLREPLPDEDPIEEAYVRFVFEFEKKEFDSLIEIVSLKVLAKVQDPEIVSTGDRFFSLKNFCKKFKEGLYVINILNENKHCSYWRSENEYKLLNSFKKPTKSCPQNFSIEFKGQNYRLSQYSLVRAEDFTNIPENYLEDAGIEDIFALVGNAIVTVTTEHLPKALHWEYDENNLLPNSVRIADFSNNPDAFVPLKNMFNLAGIEDIKRDIGEARKGTDNQFQNYLDRVAKKTTTHFREVWKEDYKNIEFSLRLNADQIIPGIKEKNTHDFARRSDGFKRFITFLLLISVNVRTDNLKNALLLVDEPDISLHPTGARYLRDELIRISRKNQVVYSTHSIFMIDSGNIGRHYIVKKKNEITSVYEAGDSNVADEEVLYNALGYSIFSILKEKNVIFEGWRDKHLFKIYIENSSEELKEKGRTIGLCHAKGVKNIKTITPLIELAKRKCLIISDSDKPAKEHQKTYTHEKGYGAWKTYQDVDGSIEAITGEDFLKNDYLTHQIQSVLTDSAVVFEKSELPEKRGKISVIQKWLRDNGRTEEQAKNILDQFKNSIFENLRFEHIEDTYAKLVNGIVTQYIEKET